MKKLTVILLLIFSWVKCFSQEERAIQPVYSGVEPYKSFFQFSLGFPGPVGAYRSGKPFESAFAKRAENGMIANLLWSVKIKGGLNLLAGIQAFVTEIDNEKFNKEYIATTGDTAEMDYFGYRHISLYTGIGYNISFLFMDFNLYATIGGMYTSTTPGEKGIFIKNAPQTNNFNGGMVHIGESIRPMAMAGIDIKVYIGFDTYILASTAYTVSSMKQRVEEFRPGTLIVSREYVNNELPVRNIAITFGIGTLFR